jgi:hypothetical protein
MAKAQEWLEENYPEGGCKRKEDKENYGKKRAEIENLDISNQNLEGRINHKESYNQG